MGSLGTPTPARFCISQQSELLAVDVFSPRSFVFAVTCSTRRSFLYIVMAASASASTSTELPKYPSFSLVKSEVHYPLPLDMNNTGECYRTACFQCPPENTNNELDYTDHADGGPGMVSSTTFDSSLYDICCQHFQSSNIYGDDDDDEEEPELARPRRAFRRRKNVLVCDSTDSF